MSRNNEVAALWVPAHVGIAGNEDADRLANEAAEGRTHEVLNECGWEASLSHLPRVATDGRAAPAPPHSGWLYTSGQSAGTTTPGVPASEGSSCGESGSRWLATTTGCCQGTPPSGSFLHERMSGAQRLGPSEFWWCNCGRRQSRHRLFVEYRAWAPQIRTLWRRIIKD